MKEEKKEKVEKKKRQRWEEARGARGHTKIRRGMELKRKQQKGEEKASLARD